MLQIAIGFEDPAVQVHHGQAGCRVVEGLAEAGLAFLEPIERDAVIDAGGRLGGHRCQELQCGILHGGTGLVIAEGQEPETPGFIRERDTNQ